MDEYKVFYFSAVPSAKHVQFGRYPFPALLADQVVLLFFSHRVDDLLGDFMRTKK